MKKVVKAKKIPRDAATDALIARVRAALPKKNVVEKRMFGGVGFMLNGNMVAGASKRGLLLRVGKDRYGWALQQPQAREMEMRGKPVEGYVRVDASALDEATLAGWIREAVAFVATLPKKADA